MDALWYCQRYKFGHRRPVPCSIIRLKYRVTQVTQSHTGARIRTVCCTHTSDIKFYDLLLSGHSFCLDRLRKIQNISWSQTSAAMLMSSALFWRITLRGMVILYRRFWTSWPLKMGPIGSSETSVKDYHSTLRNTSEKRTSHKIFRSEQRALSRCRIFLK